MMLSSLAGWLVLVAIIAACIFAYTRVKRRQVRPPTVYAVRLDGFAAVHLPIRIPHNDGVALANRLRDIYVSLWAELSLIYDTTPLPLFITDIALVDGEVEPGHPHVVWHAPALKMRARVQETLPFWFAGELHNVFRYQKFGMGRIYLSDYKPTEDERRRYYAAMTFIKERWR